MRLYFDMIPNVHDLIPARERLEWSNFWYDDTDKEVPHRILLVGDSTARMVRSKLAEFTGYSVDLLGSSSGLHDVLFVKQVDCFFSSVRYRYDAIYVQLGHHSRISEDGSPYSQKDYYRFEEDYECLIDYLSQHSDRIILLSVFYSVIPYKYHFKGRIMREVETLFRRYKKEEYDLEINNIKAEKNKIIMKLADRKSITFFDVNQYMIDLSNSPRTVCLHTDHVHYEEKAKIIIAHEYAKYLSE